MPFGQAYEKAMRGEFPDGKTVAGLAMAMAKRNNGK